MLVVGSSLTGALYAAVRDPEFTVIGKGWTSNGAATTTVVVAVTMLGGLLRPGVITPAALLIHDWPHRFRETFHHLNLTRWDMQCLNDCTPFWLHEELALLHNRRLRRLTEDEVVSAFIALRRQYQRTPSMLALANTLGYGSFPRSLVSMYRDLCNRST